MADNTEQIEYWNGLAGQRWAQLQENTDRSLAAISSLQDQLSTLNQQSSTGKIADSYAGLADTSSRVLDLTATQTRATGYDQVISNAQGKAEVMQNVLTQIGSVVGNVATSALSLAATASDNTITTVAQQAKAAFSSIASLLNTQYGGDYLFAVQEAGIGPYHIRAELGEILIGSADGRRTDDELTIFKSLGLAAEDLASAEHVYARAQVEGAGTSLPF